MGRRRGWKEGLKAMMKRLLLAILLLAPSLAHAEVDVVKIPKGAGGVGFLPLVVMEELKLVEQEAQKMGIRLGAEYIKFGGPSVVNDMLLSGNAHYAAAGPPAFITLWDKTTSNLKVKGVAAMTSIPMYLNTNAAHLKSLKDLTPNDKIAVTAVKVSIPAIIMQMAAIKEYGKADYAHYDPYTVSLTLHLAAVPSARAQGPEDPHHHDLKQDHGRTEHLHDVVCAAEVP
jgi:NitT/TauT family transport system substrate-binding protein